MSGFAPKCQFPQSILTDMVQICYVVPQKLFRDFVRKSNSRNWFSLDRVQQSFGFFPVTSREMFLQKCIKPNLSWVYFS